MEQPPSGAPASYWHNVPAGPPYQYGYPVAFPPSPVPHPSAWPTAPSHGHNGPWYSTVHQCFEILDLPGDFARIGCLFELHHKGRINRDVFAARVLPVLGGGLGALNFRLVEHGSMRMWKCTDGSALTSCIELASPNLKAITCDPAVVDVILPPYIWVPAAAQKLCVRLRTKNPRASILRDGGGLHIQVAWNGISKAVNAYGLFAPALDQGQKEYYAILPLPETILSEVTGIIAVAKTGGYVAGDEIHVTIRTTMSLAPQPPPQAAQPLLPDSEMSPLSLAEDLFRTVDDLVSFTGLGADLASSTAASLLLSSLTPLLPAAAAAAIGSRFARLHLIDGDQHHADEVVAQYRWAEKFLRLPGHTQEITPHIVSSQKARDLVGAVLSFLGSCTDGMVILLLPWTIAGKAGAAACALVQKQLQLRPNVLLVCSAGNRSAQGPPQPAPLFPAALPGPQVCRVGSAILLDGHWDCAPFSHPNGLLLPCLGGGTSLSAAVAAAVAVRLWETDSSVLTPPVLRARLIERCEAAKRTAEQTLYQLHDACFRGLVCETHPPTQQKAGCALCLLAPLEKAAGDYLLQPGRKGCNAFHLAALSGSVSLLKGLRERLDDPDRLKKALTATVADTVETPLLLALRADRREALAELAKMEPSACAIPAAQGRTPLHEALHHPDIRVFCELRMAVGDWDAIPDHTRKSLLELAEKLRGPNCARAVCGSLPPSDVGTLVERLRAADLNDWGDRREGTAPKEPAAQAPSLPPAPTQQQQQQQQSASPEGRAEVAAPARNKAEIAREPQERRRCVASPTRVQSALELPGSPPVPRRMLSLVAAPPTAARPAAVTTQPGGQCQGALGSACSCTAFVPLIGVAAANPDQLPCARCRHQRSRHTGSNKPKP